MAPRSVIQMAAHLAAALGPMSGNGQFVTLEGRKFMRDGQEFYPVVMNYAVQIASNVANSTSPGDLYYTVANEYDRSIHRRYECNDAPSCSTQFVQHLAKLTSMGFNAIRLLCPVHMREDGAGGTRRYRISIRHNNGDFPPEYRGDLDIPAFSGPLAMRYFQLLRDIISTADAAGVKTILLCADDEGGADNPGIQLTPAEDAAAAGLYAQYLSRLAAELKDEPGLLAYDLWNEPIWTNYDLLNWTKGQVCGFTSAWYDAIHQADPNHLVTLGGSSFHEIGSWDPAVMKIDFYSPHIYPEPVDLNNFDIQSSFDRLGAELYWMGISCPKPWVVGETGFSAEDDTQDPLDFFTGPDNQHLDADPVHHQMPWMMGSEAQQAAYAQFSMDATRNFLGSGYSWWGFQNDRGANLLGTAKDYLGNWWAPLKFGNDAGLPLPAPWNVMHPWRDKQMVAALQGHSLPPAPSALPEPPPAYANWHGLPDVFATYHAVDQHTGAPIEGAMVRARWQYELLGGGVLPDFWSVAVSDANGEVVVHRAPPRAGINPAPQPIEMRAHAPGASSHNTQGSWPTGTIIPFERDLLEYARTLSDVQLVWDEGRDHKAWADLIVHNGYIHDSGSPGVPVRFVARQSVRVTGEFHAGGGSEVRIHTAPTFPDCNSAAYHMAPMPPIAPPEARALEAFAAIPGSIELRFQPEQPTLSVYPNPCRDQLTLLGDASGPLTVHDSKGAIVQRMLKPAGQLAIHTQHWPAGVYRLVLETPDGPLSITLTKAR